MTTPLKTAQPDIGIVVLSCDKYSDLWPVFFELFFRFWPACPYPVYLFANKKTHNDPRVRTILSGDDPDWSSSVKACLDQIGHRYVWLFFDDVFLSRPVQADKITRLIDFIADKDPAYLRFRRFPRPDAKISRDFGRCGEKSLYRTSVLAIWRRDVLLDLLRAGESAWDFEHNTLGRAEKYPDFYGVYDDYLPHIHAVERGLWTRAAAAAVRRLGVAVDETRRSIMSNAQHRQFLKASVRTYIFNRTPGGLKPVLLSLARLSRKIVGRLLG